MRKAIQIYDSVHAAGLMETIQGEISQLYTTVPFEMGVKGGTVLSLSNIAYIFLRYHRNILNIPVPNMEGRVTYIRYPSRNPLVSMKTWLWTHCILSSETDP
jgi:hypothetical protein